MRSLMWTFGRFVGMALVFQFCLSAAVSAKPSGPTLPDWKPDGALVQQLASPVGVYQFSFQPPQGYEFSRQIVPFGAYTLNECLWAGPQRPDGTFPMVMLTTAELSRQEISRITPQKAMALGMESFCKYLQYLTPTWTHTAPESGRVNGLTFARTFWNFPLEELNTRLHGFMYETLQGTHLIAIGSLDREPEWGATVFLAEASVLTFRKRK